MADARVKNFILCEKCGKKLIERLPNGIWKFVFGKRSSDSRDYAPPVEMYIQGSIKIRCLKRSCGHWNVLHYFPNQSND